MADTEKYPVVDVVLINNPEPEVAELCEAYWCRDRGVKQWAFSCAEIEATYEVTSSRLRQLVEGYSYGVVAGNYCDQCGNGRWRLTSRAQYISPISPSLEPCRPCRDAAIQAEADAWRAYVRSRFIDKVECNKGGPIVACLPFRSLVFFLDLWNVGASEDCSSILPREQWRFELSPGFDHDMLLYLWTEGLIAVHPECPMDAFGSACEVGKPLSMIIVNTLWAVPVATVGDTDSVVAFVRRIDKEISSRTLPLEPSEVLSELAVALCCEYLAARMIEYGFSGEVGKKTAEVLRSGLAHFSMGQVFNFIWRAAKDAAAFYQRAATCRKHAENIVPGFIQRSAWRALNEGWEIRPFRRDWDLPLTALESVVVDLAMKWTPLHWFEKVTFPLAEGEEDVVVTHKGCGNE